MSDYLAMRHAVIRESATEKKIRAMDVSDIVELIHRLEDEIDELESMLAAAEAEIATLRDTLVLIDNRCYQDEWVLRTIADAMGETATP